MIEQICRKTIAEGNMKAKFKAEKKTPLNL